MLGNNRVTRWFSTMCEVSYEAETLWIQLIDILGKKCTISAAKKVDSKQNGEERNS